MREIKFRGKAINGDWVYGLLTKKKIRNSGEISYAIATGNYSLADTVPVVEDTIGEFTGCKDINGVEIYDGDIVAIPKTRWDGWQNVPTDEKEYYVVYRENGEWVIGEPKMVAKDGIYYTNLKYFQCLLYEVVGNIFEDKYNEND